MVIIADYGVDWFLEDVRIQRRGRVFCGLGCSLQLMEMDMRKISFLEETKCTVSCWIGSTTEGYKLLGPCID